ncbi:MAG: tRNA (cytidine(34)-2'-O)-methyltransferase, partial [Gammaproteobacteria bacterium]|nr:tRNA (cytidine(34)-2'-O)-methyltransferase [Gammaproteobacteria bacterium]
MFHVVLYEPEIPPNTGNIIRLCANTGATLHLIRPLGFDLDDKKLRRAGLDYREFAELRLHDSLDTFFATCNPLRTFACSTKAQQRYTDARYQAGDALLFGPEGRGLPGPVLEQLGGEQMVRIPMLANSRSLNLANAVAVIL